jgi:hypothetical protein
MPNYRALFAVAVLLPACLSNNVALEPKAQGVTIVHETDRPLHCKVLDKISGTSRSSDEPSARRGAENDFRNHAAELDANFALVEAERGGPVGTGSLRDYFLGGKALLCQTEAMEEASEKAEAAAREQKEKAETERQQKEADEKQEQAKAKKKAKK